MASFPGNWRAGLSLQGRQRIVNEMCRFTCWLKGPASYHVAGDRVTFKMVRNRVEQSHVRSGVRLVGPSHNRDPFQTIRLRMGPEQPSAVLFDLATRCEEMVYASATDLDDYVRKIALKLLTVEARIPARDSAPPLPPSTPPLSPRRTVPHDEEEEEQDFEGGDANIASASVKNNNIKV